MAQDDELKEVYKLWNCKHYNKCPVCGIELINRNQFQYHIQSRHYKDFPYSDPDATFKCVFCNKTFGTKEGLNAHTGSMHGKNRRAWEARNAMLNMKKTEPEIVKEESNPICPVKGCGAMFENESLLCKHIAKSHPTAGRVSGIKLLEDIDEAGYIVNSQNKSFDEINTLRRILTNNGINERRESIIEMFEYENPDDYVALDRILAMADITQNKRRFIVSLWKRHMSTMIDEKTDSEHTSVCMECLILWVGGIELRVCPICTKPTVTNKKKVQIKRFSIRDVMT